MTRRLGCGGDASARAEAGRRSDAVRGGGSRGGSPIAAARRGRRRARGGRLRRRDGQPTVSPSCPAPASSESPGSSSSESPSGEPTVEPTGRRPTYRPTSRPTEPTPTETPETPPRARRPAAQVLLRNLQDPRRSSTTSPRPCRGRCTARSCRRAGRSRPLEVPPGQRWASDRSATGGDPTAPGSSSTRAPSVPRRTRASRAGSDLGTIRVRRSRSRP